MGAKINPAMKAMRQALSSLRKSSNPPKIPLMPAIRPVNSINSTAARPIRAPPIAADMGVKLAMTIPLVCALKHRPSPRNGNAVYCSPSRSRRQTAPSTFE
jgi:hypothetical protein